MARGKKGGLSLEELVELALVNKENQPYEIPNNWIWIKWKECGEFIAGNGFKSIYQGFRDNEIPFYKVGSLKYSDSKGYLYDLSNTISLEMNKQIKAKIIPENSLIFAKIGEAIRLNRRCLNSKSCCIDNNLMAFISNEIIQYRYVYYWSFTQEFYDLANATTVPSIRKGDLESISIPIPPLAEQQRIVDRIESLFEKLDAAKELAQNALDSFENRKATILHKAFTGELTAKWRKENKENKENSNDILEKIIEYYSQCMPKKNIKQVSESQNNIESISSVEDSIWYKCTLGAVAIVTNGSTPSRQKSEYWNGNIPWVSSGEVKNNIITQTKEKISEYGYDNSSVKLLPKGTVLIAMIGEGKTRGQSAILDIQATINQNIAAIDTSHQQVHPKFIWYWLQKQYQANREKGNGTGPQALNCQRVRELEFILPPLKEQMEIVKILDSLFSKENQVQELCNIIEKVDFMKRSILARAFRGELGTNNPEEETAIELLKEVLKEKL